jgi:hypothetical protein
MTCRGNGYARLRNMSPDVHGHVQIYLFHLLLFNDRADSCAVRSLFAEPAAP